MLKKTWTSSSATEAHGPIASAKSLARTRRSSRGSTRLFDDGVAAAQQEVFRPWRKTEGEEEGEAEGMVAALDGESI